MAAKNPWTGVWRVKPTTTRLVAWSPFLLVALALIYGLGESVRGQPCARDYADWLARNAILAVFAFYFFFGYFLLVTRRYLGMGLISLWVGHLFAISPFLASVCSQSIARDRIGNALGFGFWAFASANAAIAAMTSVAWFLRSPASAPAPFKHRRAIFLGLVAAVTTISCCLGAAIYLATPGLEDALTRFGAELPPPTLVLFSVRPYWPIALTIWVAVLWLAALTSGHTGRAIRHTFDPSIILLLILNVLSGSLLFSIFAPALTTCACV